MKSTDNAEFITKIIQSISLLKPKLNSPIKINDFIILHIYHKYTPINKIFNKNINLVLIIISLIFNFKITSINWNFLMKINIKICTIKHFLIVI